LRTSCGGRWPRMIRRHWPFIAAVALQALIVAAVPAGRAWTLLTGRTVFLKTAPVDPYDILSGYHVVISYEISALDRLPGNPALKRGEHVYVVLTPGQDGFWHPVTAGRKRPETVAPDEVVIRGARGKYGRIDYGIEHYFIPEGKGEEIAGRLRAARDTARAEVKVDALGHAALVRLHVGGVTYDY